MPRPPPSLRCIRTTPMRASARRMWMTRRTVAMIPVACLGAHAAAPSPGYVMATGPNGQRKVPVNSGCHPGQASGSEREPGARASVWAVALDPRLKAAGDDESGWLGEAAPDNVRSEERRVGKEGVSQG